MQKIYFYNKEKEKLVGILHKNKSDKGIIICHGFTGNKDRNFIPKLAKRLSKYQNILRFDFSGNGESEGKFEDQCYSKYVEELNSAINYLKNLKIKEIIVIGHSLGGNIVILEEAKYKNIDKLILLAPALYITKRKVFRYSFLIEYFIALFKGHIKFIDSWGEKRRLKKRFFLERILISPIKYLKNIKKPILIILAERDKVIPLKKSADLCKNYNINCKIIKDSGHTFAKEIYLNQVISKITKWIK